MNDDTYNTKRLIASHKCITCKHCLYWDYDQWMETMYVECELGVPDYCDGECESYEPEEQQSHTQSHHT